MIVDVKTERSIDIVFDHFAQSRLTADEPFRAANHIVAVRKQTGLIGGRIRGHVKDVPDVLGDGKGRPLERNT